MPIKLQNNGLEVMWELATPSKYASRHFAAVWIITAVTIIIFHVIYTIFIIFKPKQEAVFCGCVMNLLAVNR